MISKIDKYGLLIKLQDQVTIKYSIRYRKQKYLQIIKIKILWSFRHKNHQHILNLKVKEEHINLSLKLQDQGDSIFLII